MSRWSSGRARDFLYRAIVKCRVELERRGGNHDTMKRAVARPGRANLSWLAAVYGSDKGATAHKYVDLYEQHLGPVRADVRRVLEIGVYRGASLQMWRDFFPLADIIGVDIAEVSVAGPRIETVRGDQSDPAVLERLRAMGPFDVIIDDGSHQAAQLIATFNGLFNSVTPGGFYVIEDMHTAYDVDYGGGAPGTHDTSVALIQRMVDAVNREHVESRYPEAAAPMPMIDALHVYPKIAFLRRSLQPK